MTISKIVSEIKSIGIEVAQDAFISVPKSHCFMTWRIKHRRAEGADGYNMYWVTTYKLHIFYRDLKTSEDWQFEKKLENGILRPLDELECEYEYNDTDKMDVTTYSFVCVVDFDEEEI